MAASLKSLLISLRSQQLGMLILLIVALGTHNEMAKAQTNTCTSELSDLNVCAPFVVPGAPNTNPSSSCCNALQAVDRDCLCNTIRISSQLPSQCQLPPLTCKLLTKDALLVSDHVVSYVSTMS
ncbi:hypothetical protein VNO77_33518 [Canavalia gladiata]|uniref:Bifunctional inhibitor/plant lipid transfer protein/seed storage helical domain-containing protein n=1 Tax=Canavalia gladiata TaxID=3824 RepID=A0AAN9KDX2_CANGL